MNEAPDSRPSLRAPAPKHPLSAAEVIEPRVRRLVDEALLGLRQEGRKAVRIVHIGCGSGAELMRSALHALSLGFVAVEARGLDESADTIAAARRAAVACRDPRLCLAFERAEIGPGLAKEAEHDVDILLCDRRLLKRLPLSRRGRVARRIHSVASQLILAGGRR